MSGQRAASSAPNRDCIAVSASVMTLPSRFSRRSPLMNRGSSSRSAAWITMPFNCSISIAVMDTSP